HLRDHRRQRGVLGQDLEVLGSRRSALRRLCPARHGQPGQQANGTEEGVLYAHLPTLTAAAAAGVVYWRGTTKEAKAGRGSGCMVGQFFTTINSLSPERLQLSMLRSGGVPACAVLARLEASASCGMLA